MRVLRVDTGEHATIALVDLVAVVGIVEEEGEVVEEAQRVIGSVRVDREELALGGAPAPVEVEVRALRLAAFVGIDRAEARDQTLADGPKRNLPRAVPVGAIVGGPEREIHALRQRGARLREDVEALVAVHVLERTIASIGVDRDEALEGVAGRRQQGQVALGVEHSAGDLDRVRVDEILRNEVHGARRGEVPELE